PSVAARSCAVSTSGAQTAFPGLLTARPGAQTRPSWTGVGEGSGAALCARAVADSATAPRTAINGRDIRWLNLPFCGRIPEWRSVGNTRFLSGEPYDAFG